MVYDQQAMLLTTNLSDYRIYSASDIPLLKTYLVETNEPGGPFGAKGITDVAFDGMAPAVANAVADALGVRLWQLPLTPERVLHAIHAHAAKK